MCNYKFLLFDIFNYKLKVQVLFKAGINTFSKTIGMGTIGGKEIRYDSIYSAAGNFGRKYILADWQFWRVICKYFNCQTTPNGGEQLSCQ